MNLKITVFVAVLLFVMWGMFIFYLFRYGEDVRINPCSVCAKKMGGGIICSMTGAGGTAIRTFLPNGSYIDISIRVNNSYPKINLSNYSLTK